MTSTWLVQPPLDSVLVLLSGGLDSTTALALMRSREDRRVEALFINYGQRHIRERQASQLVAKHYGVPWTELDLRAYGQSVASALTSQNAEIPHGHYAADTMAQTVVPGRNATFLAAAAGIARSREIGWVGAAMHQGDHPIYPDCRPEFVKAMNEALRAGYGVGIEAPFLFHTKAEIVTVADRLGAPAQLSWSCYEGGELHCGRCGTCVERAEAFADAGVEDPTPYLDNQFWRVATNRTADVAPLDDGTAASREAEYEDRRAQGGAQRA